MSLPVNRSEVTPIRTHSVPQTIETPVTFVPVPNAYVRYAYSRSSDSMANQIEGQDYLCFRHNDQRLVFVVADGVGSSFCGNLASRILGDNLLDWLWSLDVGYLGGEAALTESASAYLNKLQKQAQVEVEEYEIPAEITGLVRQALESQRAYGSEAIFAACRIDHPNPMMPDGLVSIFWMGDTRIRVLRADGGEFDLSGDHNLANRWSTAQGVRGTMSAWMRPLGDVARVAAYSDGLSAHEGKLLGYPDAKLDREIALGALEPTSDDVSFIDVVLRTPVYEGYPDPDLPDPNLERPHLEQIWNPTGDPIYELRWAWPGGNGGRISYIIQEATSPILTDSRTINVTQGATSWQPASPQEPGHYYYRVRGVKRFGGLTPWSELRQAKVAYPPPPAPALFPVEPDKAAVLHWEGDGEFLTYTLERANNPDFEDAEIVFEGRSTAWAIPTDQPGSWYFRVRATSDGGAGPWSEAETVDIVVPAPPTPSLGSVVQGMERGSYTLRWQQVPRATYYEIEEVNHADSDAEPVIIKVGNDTDCAISQQPVGEYVYRIRACHDHGCSPWSNEQFVVVAPEAPDEAPDLTLDGPDEEHVIRLTWTEVAEADEYLVEIASDPDFAAVRELVVEDTSLALIRREPGALFVRVCGANAGGEGPWSNVESLSLEPPAPDWIEATLDEDGQKVLISWAAVGGSVNYEVEMARGFAGDAVFASIYADAGTQTAIPIPEDAAHVRFRVRTHTPGVNSPWVESGLLRIKSGPAAPLLKQPTMTQQGEFLLNWEAGEEVEHYLLEVSEDETFGKVRSIQVDEPHIRFRPPARGKYWFRVRVVTGDDAPAHHGDPSNIVHAAVWRPVAPRLWPHDPVPAEQNFQISWAGVPDCTYYEIQGSADPDFPPEKTRTVRVFHPEQKKLIKGMDQGAYHFRVKAVTAEGESSPWSATITVNIT